MQVSDESLNRWHSMIREKKLPNAPVVIGIDRFLRRVGFRGRPFMLWNSSILLLINFMFAAICFGVFTQFSRIGLQVSTAGVLVMTTKIAVAAALFGWLGRWIVRRIYKIGTWAEFCVDDEKKAESKQI